MLELLFLLLPVAAFTGWLSGRRSTSRKSGVCPDIPADYLKGLNFLLNEQPDKAIDIFIQMLEVNKDTVETHLALGSLFRRRGEVDRAIRIHQNLIARPTLLPEQRANALFELGQDYMRAGLFDRAETLFSELVNSNPHSEQALQYLLDIYQQEKDWNMAIQVAQRLETKTGKKLHHMVAHFYCELAELAIKQGEWNKASKLVRKALSIDTNSVRASLLEAQIEHQQGNDKSSIKALKRVEQQDAEYIAEAIDMLRSYYQSTGKNREFIDYLQHVLQRHDSISIMLALADVLRQEHGDEAAEKFISDFLRDKPSVKGMGKLIDLHINFAKDPVRERLHILKDIINQMILDKPVYKCHVCGFNGKTLHWQCPGCKNWNTIKPIHGVEGE